MNRLKHCTRLIPSTALLLVAACSNPKTAPEAPAEPAATPAPIIKALSPAASIETMQMPRGYQLEPVLTEPDIADTWEREGEEPRSFFDTFSPRGYAIGVNVVIYAMSH